MYNPIQTEAPLLIKPFLPLMTKSELHAVLTGGFATIAGGVLAAYIGFGVSFTIYQKNILTFTREYKQKLHFIKKNLKEK